MINRRNYDIVHYCCALVGKYDSKICQQIAILFAAEMAKFGTTRSEC